MDNMATEKAKWESKPLKTEQEGNYAFIYWTGTEVKDIDNADKYVFKVRRYKDIVTKEEYLNVRVYLSHDAKEIYAEIKKTNIIELESELLNLRMYGVLLGRKYFPKIRQAIENVYLDLTARPVDESTELTSEIINSIYEMFVHYIKESGIEVDKNGYYNISVGEFKDCLSDSKYSKYKYSDVRAELADFCKDIDGTGKKVNGIKCSFGRNDNTIAKGDKRIKVISFVPEVVDSYQVT